MITRDDLIKIAHFFDDRFEVIKDTYQVNQIYIGHNVIIILLKRRYYHGEYFLRVNNHKGLFLDLINQKLNQ